MKVGILGAGFGAYHASIYKKNAFVESIKIFGRSEEKLGRIKSDLDIEVSTNIDEILNDPYIDLIDVCLPNGLHREYVVKALEKGKNVFCETPISTNLDDAEVIEEAEVRYGKKVFINLFLRLDPSCCYIHDIIKNNTYGELKTISVKRKTAPVWGSLGYDKIVTNLMIHDIDFIIWLLGMPNEITALGVSKNQNEANVNAFLKYANTTAEVIGSSMMPISYPFTVGYDAVFENGLIEYREECFEKGDVKSIVEYSSKGKKEIVLCQDNPIEKVINHVIEGCEKENKTMLSVKDAVNSLRIALKIKDLIL